MDELTDGRVHCGRGAERGCGLSGVIPLLRHQGPANGEMVLLNVSLPRDETDGRTADERANGRTSGRTDGGTAVAARGGGCGLCGVILLLRHPGRRPRRLTRLNSEGFVRGAGRGPRPPPPPPPSPPLSAQYTHGLTPPPRPLSPTHPPHSGGGNVWREGNFESPYLRDCRCGFETRGGVEELPFILVSETRHGAGATGGGAPDFKGGLPTLRGGGSAGGP